jgi:imidazolonepropionase-like amidohydrolase
MKLAALLLACSTFLWAGSKKTNSVFVFTNVNVVDVQEGSVHERLTVVVRDGRITGIAAIGLIDEGRNTKIVNAHGKFLIPGLWDMHVHTAFSDPPWDEKLLYPLYIANGITGVRDMGGVLDSLEVRRQHVDKSETLGPHIVLGGPFLVGGKSDSQSIAVNTPEEARNAVDSLKKRHVDFVKILSNIPRDAYFAIATEAKKDHLPLVGHVPVSVSLAEAANAGQKSIEHLTGFGLAASSQESELRAQILQASAAKDRTAYYKALHKVSETFDAAKAGEVISQLVKNNTWQAPTLVWTMAQAGGEVPDPALKYVPASIRRQWSTQAQQTSPEQLSEYKNDAQQNPKLVKEMHRVGVHFLAGSDGPDPMVVPGFSLHRELELLVEAGLTPVEALRTATANPAKFLGNSDKYGAIEKGHVADLVLLEANPLVDIRNTRKIAGVMMNGNYHTREELDGILLKIEEEAATK